MGGKNFSMTEVFKLSSIIGNIDNEYLVKLLEKSNGSVDAAANAHFDKDNADLFLRSVKRLPDNMHEPDILDLTEDSLLRDSNRKEALPSTQFPLILGLCVVDAEASISSKSCSQFLRKDTNLYVRPQHIPLSSIKKKPTFNRSQGPSSIVRLSAIDHRWKTREEIEFARIPKYMADVLSPLMNLCLVEVKAKALEAANELRPFMKFKVSLEIIIPNSSIFELFSEKRTEFTRKWDKETIELLKLSFYELIMQIHPDLNPMIQPTSCPSTKMSENPDHVDMEDLEDEEYDTQNLDAKPIQANVLHLLKCLKVDLRPHQDRALRWMRDRESRISSDLPHPLWTPVKTDALSKKALFYINVFTKEISLGEPKITEVCRGGILADEMGLGKTISVLALLVSSWAPDSTSKRLSALEGPTLIVCPTSLVGQWKNEILQKIDVSQTSKGAGSVDEIPADEDSISGSEETLIVNNETLSEHNTIDDATAGDFVREEIFFKATEANEMKHAKTKSDSVPPRVLVYHEGRAKRNVNFNNYDIVITTYGVVAEERKGARLEMHSEILKYLPDPQLKNRNQVPTKDSPKNGLACDQSSSFIRRSLRKRQKVDRMNPETLDDHIDVHSEKTTPVADTEKPRSGKHSNLHDFEWTRIILDEGHVIKNSQTSSFQGCQELRTKDDRRWILTGTPVQNGLDDLFSLFKFIRLQPWCNDLWWKKIVTDPLSNGKRAIVVNTIQSIIATGPVLLRRTKKSAQCFDVRLPAKIVEIIQLDFQDEQQEFYDKLYRTSLMEFRDLVGSGQAKQKYAQIFALLMKLRQCCNHSALAVPKSSTNCVEKEKYVLRKVSKLLMNKNASDVAYVKKQVQKFLRKSKNIFAADIPCTTNEESSPECPVCLGAQFSDPVVTSCGHFFCRSCLIKSLPYFRKSGCPVCREVISEDDLISVGNDEIAGINELVKSQQKEKGSKISWIIDSLTHIANLNINRQTSSVAKHNLELKDYLADVDDDVREAPLKVVVFSQWTSFLDMVEPWLHESSLRFARLDGSLSAKNREKVIDDFLNSKEVNILLISLKAGALGLNLIAASIVYVVDPWFNPAIEEQAINRCHRMGQTRPVYVYRLYMNNTVEMKIKKLQETKLKLAEDALLSRNPEGELSDNAESNNALSYEQLASFFQ